MSERVHASVRTNRSRRGFTLIELLVVMAVIAVLMTLTAAGVMGWMNGNSRNITDAELKTIQAILMQHWSAVVDDAKKERLWSSDESTLIAQADNDLERARIMMIKIRLMEAFPVNFAELPLPTNGNECYATTTPGGAALSLIPTKKRRFRQGYQNALYGANNLPRWNQANQTGRDSVESAVCLLLALNTSKQGINLDTDQLKPYLKDVDSTGNSFFADAWGTPIRFYRFATQKIPSGGTTDQPLEVIAPPGLVVPTAVDPLDVNGKLFTWFTPGTTTRSTNAMWFDSTIHLCTYTSAAGATIAEYAIPVLASAGPDGKFGIPAVDAITTTSTNASGAMTYAGAAPYQDMSVKSSTDEADNLYSFRKQGS